MRYWSLILFLLLITASVNAQSVFERRISVQGRYGFSNAVFQNSDGSYYLFANQPEYVGPAYATSGDPIIYKISEDGTILWSKRLNLNGDVVSVAQDSVGSFIVNVIYWTDVAGLDYRFISHVSKNIDSSWTESIRQNLRGLYTRDSKGHIDSVVTVVSDSFTVYIDNYSWVNHDDSVLIVQNLDSSFSSCGLIKVSNDREIKWSLRLDDGIDPLNIIPLSDSGIFLLLGEWNPSHSYHGDKMFIAKMDRTGNAIWNHSLDIAKNSSIVSACEADNGDIIAIGNSDSNSFILKFNKDGILQKAKKYSVANATPNFLTIIRTQDHGCIIAGDILRPVRDTNEILLLKLDSTLQGCNLSDVTCSISSANLLSSQLLYHTLRDTADNRIFTSALNDPLHSYQESDICSDNTVPSVLSNSQPVYPNPVLVNQILSIPLDGLGESGGYTLSILNVVGAVVHSEELRLEAGQQHIQVSVNDLLPGSYVIDVKDSRNSGSHRFKFIKE
ncbi:MAG TPA: T9SS type A sorting domain-containing protein [Candidatus Kapabacteria bacterium]|nr:T9SS type A sorting domain-containing protein [Candidatus Kapabacteria bacterium]